MNVNIFVKKHGGLIRSTKEKKVPYKIKLVGGRDWSKFKKWFIRFSLRKYIQSKDNPIIISSNWELSEGLVPYKGLLGETVHQLVGGVKSCFGYCGSKNISEFYQKSKFVQITSSGIVESHPHDMNITKDSPNYRKLNLK